MKEQRKIGLNTKLTVLIASVILTTVVVLSIQMIRNEFSQTNEELRKDGLTIAEMAARNVEFAIYTEDKASLTAFLESLAVDPSIVSAAVLDRENRVLAGMTFRSGEEGAEASAEGSEEGVHSSISESMKDGRMTIVAPVLSMQHSFGDDILSLDPIAGQWEETLGYVSVTMDTAGAKERVRAYINRAVLFTTLLLILGVSLTVLVTRRIVSPLQDLSEAAREISAGRFDRETDIRTSDEIADLGRSFNEMVRSLRHYRLQAEERTTALEESNRIMEREMTERKKLETQLLHAQKMEAVGHLAGGVAHDFNNILMAITSFASLLKMDAQEGSTALHYINEITSSADRASQLTKNLLAFSRKQNIAPEAVDINDIVLNLQSMISRLLGEHIDQKLLLCDGELGVLGDRNQVEQMLVNLATNARDAMPGGGVLTVETERKEFDEEFVRFHGYGRPGTYAMISISDSGEGLDPEVREKIFEPFFTTKDVDKGTGLGLSIVYGIIKQHKGYVDVYSEKGRGTRFAIYLPLVEGTVPKRADTADIEVAGGSETILLAEDEDKLRSALVTILSRHGYRVIEARDGEEAVEKFRELGRGIDLMLSDVMMPRKNGKEAYDEIVGESGPLRTIFMSGYSEKVLPGGVDLGEGVGMLQKPVDPLALLLKIREAFDGASSATPGPLPEKEGAPADQ